MENRILEKCPQCGMAISEKKRRCERCGLPVSTLIKMAGSQEVEPPQTEEMLQASPQNEVPVWRREVSEKLKAYEQRKRTLLTPPSPIKETVAESSANTDAVVDDHQSSVTPAQTVAKLRQRAAHPLSSTPDQPIAPPRAEIWNTDLEELRRNLELEEDASSRGSLFLARRTASFLVDNTIIVVLYSLIVFLFSYFFGLDLVEFVQSSWPSFAGVFLLAHCLYYVYFYSTSRQTPGQVFVALEVRDPNSARIDFVKVVIRWAVMVGLNALNLLPVLFKKNYLLSDKLSGTEIRSLRQ